MKIYFRICSVRAHVKKIVICRSLPHGFQKSENLFFTGFFLPVYIFSRRQAKNGDGKKNMGCKKNSGVKKVIARPRFPTKICLQITIIFTCALTFRDSISFAGKKTDEKMLRKITDFPLENRISGLKITKIFACGR